MKLIAAVAIAFAVVSSAHAQKMSTIGAIAVPERDSMVCTKPEDVLPANDAWRQLVSKQISMDEFSKWLKRCGLIKAGKAALVRDQMKIQSGGDLVCVETFANVASAEAQSRKIGKCRWSLLLGDAYAAVQEGRRVGSPEDKLFEAYWRYAHVQFCRKVREHYLMVYISEPEFERAQTAMNAIKRKVLADNPALDTDAIWRKALDDNSGLPASDNWCKRLYHELLQLSPVGVVNIKKR